MSPSETKRIQFSIIVMMMMMMMAMPTMMIIVSLIVIIVVIKQCIDMVVIDLDSIISRFSR